METSKKFYGVFNVCSDGRHKERLLSRLFDVFCAAVPSDAEEWFFKSGLVFTDKKAAVSEARWQRDLDRGHQRYSRCKSLTTKFFIHRCDETGRLLPTKKELAETVRFFMAHHPNASLADVREDLRSAMNF